MKPRLFAALFLLVSLALGLPGARAQEDLSEAGREKFVKICSPCHGAITEDAASLTWENLRLPVVMNPVGPNLTHVYGRPAGKMEGYLYSKAFQAAAPNIGWTEENLDRWITDSQAMIRGSSMFLKVPDPAVRATIIAYLRRYAPYTGPDCVC